MRGKWHLRCRLAIFAAAILVGAGLTGCRPAPEAPRAPASSLRELHVALAGLGELSTVDPVRAGETAPIIVSWHLYDRLVAIDSRGGLIPGLATEWASSDDLAIWRFKIRRNALFHPAAPGLPPRRITAEDARASIIRALRTPGFAQTLLGDLLEGAPELLEGTVAELPGLVVEDEYLVFRLTRPFAYLPERLAASFFSVVPAETSLDTVEPPTGSGPYQLISWDQTAQRIELAKFPDYWGSTTSSSPDRLVLHGTPQEGVAVEELVAGTVDWLEANVAALRIVQSATSRARIVLRTPAQPDIRLVAFNFNRSPFNDSEDSRNLRVALNQAVDRSDLIRILGAGESVGGPVPSIGGHAFTTDVEHARTLVESIGPDARELELLVQPGEENRIIAEQLKKQWEAIGLRLTLQPGRADFLDRITQGNFQMALAYYGPFLPTPEQYLWPYLEGSQPIPNIMNFRSEEFEVAYQAYTSSLTSVERDRQLQIALATLLRDPPVVWLVRTPMVVGVRVSAEVPRVGSIPLFGQLEVKNSD